MILWYLISDNELQAQFLALKNNGIISEEVTFEEFFVITTDLEIWPPGSPDPKKARPRDVTG